MKAFRTIIFVLLTIHLAGCAVHKAANAPVRKDVSVLREGTSRDIVLAELGNPSASGEENGQNYDIFKFQKGYTGGEKFLHATGHGIADVMTLGLWEIIGTPTESMAQDKYIMVKVYYDAHNDVAKADYLKKD